MSTLMEETYTPPRDARERFHEQQSRTRAAARQVKEKILELRDVPEHLTKGSDAHAHFEFLDAQVTTYKGLAKVLSNLDSALQGQEEEAEPGDGQELSRIDQTYVKMTVLLRKLEQDFKHVLGLPSNWFAAATLQCVSWVESHPKTAAGIVLGLGTGLAAGAGGWTHWNGYCIILRLLGGCACKSWGVAGSAAAGGVVGLVAGAALVSLFHFCYRRYAQRAQQEHRSAFQEAEEMCGKFRELLRKDHAELDGLIDDLTASFVRTFEAPLAAIPMEPGDRMCVICLREEAEVERPVRMPRCGGKHFLCKGCAEVYIRSSFRCPCCNV